jgi:hypothetical protein
MRRRSRASETRRNLSRGRRGSISRNVTAATAVVAGGQGGSYANPLDVILSMMKQNEQVLLKIKTTRAGLHSIMQLTVKQEIVPMTARVAKLQEAQSATDKRLRDLEAALTTMQERSERGSLGNTSMALGSRAPSSVWRSRSGMVAGSTVLANGSAQPSVLAGLLRT